MKKVYWFILLAVALVSIALFINTRPVGATAVEKVTWCHCEPNGNCQMLELPQAALENAGHVNASGNPLHAGDHAGACVEVTVTPEPSGEVTPTPEVTPSVTPEVTATPSATPGPDVVPNNPTDGLSDGRSSCPECTQPPKTNTVVPATAPATGRGL